MGEPFSLVSYVWQRNVDQTILTYIGVYINSIFFDVSSQVISIDNCKDLKKISSSKRIHHATHPKFLCPVVGRCHCVWSISASNQCPTDLQNSECSSGFSFFETSPKLQPVLQLWWWSFLPSSNELSIPTGVFTSSTSVHL